MLIESFFIALGINLLLFIPAFWLKTDKLTDFSYGFSFLAVAVFLYLTDTAVLAKTVLLLMIGAWAVRLISYLFIRIIRIKRDKRFDDIREKFFKFLSFWVFQGISVWIILLPSIFFFTGGETSLGTLSLVGVAVWFFGLGLETLADYQKYTFINNPQNKGRWIEEGVWRYSRHPNYLGEILNWTGIFIFTLPALAGPSLFLGILSPLYISFLLIFVSGIPKLEDYADKRWGNDLKYQEYKKRVGILLPKISA